MLLDQSVLVVSPLMCILADNPRASEILNHLGPSARRFCRMCMVSSYVLVKFFRVVSIQVDRDVDPTVVDDRRSLGSSLKQMEEIRLKPLQKEKTRLQTQ